jgi:hypothetical protein
MKKDNFEGAQSQKYVVCGSYLYYHYMQDNFNDNVSKLSIDRIGMGMCL